MASGGDGILDEYQWEKLPDMPTARCYTVGAHHDGKLYVFGGCSQINLIIPIYAVLACA